MLSTQMMIEQCSLNGFDLSIAFVGKFKFSIFGTIKTRDIWSLISKEALGTVMNPLHVPISVGTVGTTGSNPG